MKSNVVYIYGLFDKNDVCIYVGKSNRPSGRSKQHHLILEFEYLEILDSFVDRELEWIDKFENQGITLQNKERNVKCDPPLEIGKRFYRHGHEFYQGNHRYLYRLYECYQPKYPQERKMCIRGGIIKEDISPYELKHKWKVRYHTINKCRIRSRDGIYYIVEKYNNPNYVDLEKKFK